MRVTSQKQFWQGNSVTIEDSSSEGSDFIFELYWSQKMEAEEKKYVPNFGNMDLSEI